MFEKYGFVYIWFDRKHKRYYIGSRWGHVDDGYVCSSRWMKQAYGHRPKDFKRRILKTITNRKDLLNEEQRWLNMIKPEEIKHRYYNLTTKTDHLWYNDPNKTLTVGEKISKTKKGKSTGPCSLAKAMKISEVKRANFERKRHETGSSYTPEQLRNLSECKKGKLLAPEHKEKISNGLKLAYIEGRRI